jgi:flagellar basal body-associated protein FliL
MDRAKEAWKKSEMSMKAIVIIVVLVIIILIVLIIIRRTMLHSRAEEGGSGNFNSFDNKLSSDSSSAPSGSRSDSSSSSDSRPRAVNNVPAAASNVVVVGSKGMAATQPTCGAGNCNEDKHRVQNSIQNSISRNQAQSANHQQPRVENITTHRIQKPSVRFEVQTAEDEENQNESPKTVVTAKPRRFMSKNDE